jgi:hypothetical protein
MIGCMPCGRKCGMRCWSCGKDLAMSAVNEMMRMLRPGTMFDMESPFITRQRIRGTVLLSLDLTSSLTGKALYPKYA